MYIGKPNISAFLNTMQQLESTYTEIKISICPKIKTTGKIRVHLY